MIVWCLLNGKTIKMISQKIDKKEIINSLKKLVAINTVFDDSTKKESAPFGLGIKKAFDLIVEIAYKSNLKVLNLDGYVLEISFGEEEQSIGILTHVDTVSANESDWITDPFVCVEKEGRLWGRGVCDDKGPLVICLYLLKYLADNNIDLGCKIILIIGGAEETSWDCIQHYLSKKAPPTISFSPDCDFPVVNCEKGILQYVLYKDIHENTNISFSSDTDFNTICYRLAVTKNNETTIYETPKQLSRNPARSKNAFFNFIEHTQSDCIPTIKKLCNTLFLNDIYGKKLGIESIDEDGNKNTISVSFVNYNHDKLEIGLDVRYVSTISKKNIQNTLEQLFIENDLKYKKINDYEMLFFNKKHLLVKTLLESYLEVCPLESKIPLTKGGRSYSRAINNCVGFGASFPHDNNNVHKANETILINKLFLALDIYYIAINNLAKKILCFNESY